MTHKVFHKICSPINLQGIHSATGLRGASPKDKVQSCESVSMDVASATTRVDRRSIWPDSIFHSRPDDDTLRQSAV